MTTSQHNFIQHEIAVWGESYVFDLLERFEPIELIDAAGNSKWSWIKSETQVLPSTDVYNQPLRESYTSDIVAVG